jgi:hypothetical protein
MWILPLVTSCRHRLRQIPWTALSCPCITGAMIGAGVFPPRSRLQVATPLVPIAHSFVHRWPQRRRRHGGPGESILDMTIASR